MRLEVNDTFSTHSDMIKNPFLISVESKIMKTIKSDSVLLSFTLVYVFQTLIVFSGLHFYSYKILMFLVVHVQTQAPK